MKIPTLITNYSKYTDARLDQKAQAIIVALTDNANFPGITTALATFTDVAGAYTLALTASATRDKLAVSLKRDARENLLGQMRSLSITIESLAVGDRSKLVSSGFDLSTDGELSSTLLPIKSFSMADGNNPGEIRLLLKGAENAKSFLFQVAIEPITLESNWISKVASTRECTFTALPSGKRVFAKVTAVGSRGQEITTPILNRVVQ